MINSIAYYNDFWNEMRGKMCIRDSTDTVCKGIIKFQVARKQGKRVWLFCKIWIHRTIRQKQNKRKI